MMYYFAYGSNLSSKRLKARLPSVKLVASGKLYEHRLKFQKFSSIDGSAKGDAYFTGEEKDCLLGAIYELDIGEIEILDNIEGLGNGYEKKLVDIYDISKPAVASECKNIAPKERSQSRLQSKLVKLPLTAFTYYATHIEAGISPFCWYKQHVLEGAQEHDFPHEYIEFINQHHCIEDSNIQRVKMELSIYL